MSVKKLAITESDRDVIDEWFVQAHEQTVETLPAFVEHLCNDYQHDYGTICMAMVAAAVAACWAIDKSPQGGITGFQAGAVMWEFIKRWMGPGGGYGGPMRLLTFEEMLYPAHADEFGQVLPASTWEWLQKEARKHLVDEPEYPVAPSVEAHWQSIVDGKVPFGWMVEAADEAVA